VIRLCDSLGVDVIAEGIESTAREEVGWTGQRPGLHVNTPTKSGILRSLAVPREVPSGR